MISYYIMRIYIYIYTDITNSNATDNDTYSDDDMYIQLSLLLERPDLLDEAPD